ncbi:MULTISPECIES: glycosyltransferase 87 family protein [Microbacterium]|uniref:DUF2029 domain-containing protein n=1 Tax=Microbacterium saccharophilum TaxID=1213358 RepID=A0A7Z7GDD5_9MICO|nr:MULTISPECIES: glycosyltransferase 87 family protein [Microbacterium]SFI40952.1 Protein of unknown function [Microbacterium saccharophilum]
MSRRSVLWIAFVLVHLGVSWLGFVMPNEPMGDVYRVYEPWSAQALRGGGIVGVDSAWVYPQLALVPMVLTQIIASLVGSYTVAWAVLVALADAVAFAVLVGRGRSTGRAVAAWFWLAAIALLGPVGIYRLDGFTVPIVILACLWIIGRPWVASLLLSAVTWMKVWPAAVLAAAVIAARRRGALIGGAVVISALTLAAVVAAGGAANAFGFISDQTTRGLQVEAPVSMPYLWGALLRLDGFWVYYSMDLLTFQVTGTEIDTVIAAMTPLLILAVSAVAVLGAVQAARGVRFVALFPTLALALVTAFIVFNKVGSPQYLCWLIPPVLIGLVLDRADWFAPAGLTLGAALLTQLVYPVLYADILYPAPLAVTLLTLRNLVLVALFVWMVVRLARLHPRVRARIALLHPIP